MLYYKEPHLWKQIIFLQTLFKGGANWNFMLWVPKLDSTVNRNKENCSNFFSYSSYFQIGPCMLIDFLIFIHVCKKIVIKAPRTHSSLMLVGRRRPCWCYTQKALRQIKCHLIDCWHTFFNRIKDMDGNTCLSQRNEEHIYGTSC